MKYATVVADPPWAYDTDKTLRWQTRHGDRHTTGQGLDYPSLTVHEIAAVPVRDLAAKDAHAYLWTTQRYLRDALWIVEAWGFTLSKILTWAKNPRGWNVGGTYASASEFVLYARRGDLPALTTIDRDWFNWPRPAKIKPLPGIREFNGFQHSAKPDAFYDMVEQVSPGPRLDIFARRQRLGWDTYGDECLQHVDAAPTVAKVPA